MRFYAITTGSYDDYTERFIQADCPFEAVHKFLRSGWLSHSEVGTIWEAAINEHSIIHKTRELCDVELPGLRGYLWSEEFNKKFHSAAGVVCCCLCGDWPGSEPADTFLNADHKCPRCAALKQVT